MQMTVTIHFDVDMDSLFDEICDTMTEYLSHEYLLNEDDISKENIKTLLLELAKMCDKK